MSNMLYREQYISDNNTFLEARGNLQFMEPFCWQFKEAKGHWKSHVTETKSDHTLE